MAYCNVTSADSYFEKRAFASAWDGEDKEKFLETATQQIKDFCKFEDENGIFVYENDAAPDWLKRAACELALHLMNLGKDPTQNDKKTTLGIISTDGTVFDKEFRADVLCLNCRRILENNGGILAAESSAEGGISFGWIEK